MSCGVNWGLRQLPSSLPPWEKLDKCLLPYFLHRTVDWCKARPKALWPLATGSSSDAQGNNSWKGKLEGVVLDPTTSPDLGQLGKRKEDGLHSSRDLPPGLLRFALAQHILIQRWQQKRGGLEQEKMSGCSPLEREQEEEEEHLFLCLEKPVHLPSLDASQDGSCCGLQTCDGCPEASRKAKEGRGRGPGGRARRHKGWHLASWRDKDASASRSFTAHLMTLVPHLRGTGYQQLRQIVDRPSNHRALVLKDG